MHWLGLITPNQGTEMEAMTTARREPMKGAVDGRTTIPPAVLRCINLGKPPTVHDLCTVADHIRSDLKSGCQKGQRNEGSGALFGSSIYRAAHAALLGTPDRELIT